MLAAVREGGHALARARTCAVKCRRSTAGHLERHSALQLLRSPAAPLRAHLQACASGALVFFVFRALRVLCAS
eukprot:3563150-Pleurochrysis_carterae.AAC.1